MRAIDRLPAASPAIFTLLSACAGVPDADRAAADTIAAALFEACPVAEATDEAARELCADALADSGELRSVMGPDLLWGGHTDHPTYDPADHHLTRFDARIFRKMYLSTFMFEGTSRIESRDGFTILRLDTQFRSQLDIGSYPYPFWHSEDKWEAYQGSTEVLVVISEGRVVAAYRAGDDPDRPRTAHSWDGEWTWTDPVSGEPQPRVTLYAYLLSDDNPHAEALNDAYRALEGNFREQTCTTCHAPDNSNQMGVLNLLTYPNQALGERHALVEVLEQNTMPPSVGVGDADTLATMLELARAFAEAGDDALQHEGEPL